MTTDKLLTVREAAEYLRVPLSFVYARTRNGTIPCRRIGSKLIRIPLRELLLWVEEHER
jgi:excisionase family DNA binding protein